MPLAINSRAKTQSSSKAVPREKPRTAGKATQGRTIPAGGQLTGKVFMNGRSQAVRLPAQLRVAANELYVRRDPHSGDLILSERPHTKRSIAEILADIDSLGGLGESLNGIDRQPSSKVDLQLD